MSEADDAIDEAIVVINTLMHQVQGLEGVLARRDATIAELREELKDSYDSNPRCAV